MTTFTVRRHSKPSARRWPGTKQPSAAEQGEGSPRSSGIGHISCLSGLEFLDSTVIRSLVRRVGAVELGQAGGGVNGDALLVASAEVGEESAEGDDSAAVGGDEDAVG
jgi:hypothetical protein